MKIVLIGGTWDNGNGKPSAVFKNLAKGFSEAWIGANITYCNGGNLPSLLALLPELVPALNILVWMPNISNEEAKTVRQLKKLNPSMVLVTSKRNNAGKYSIADIISHGLACKSNLILEIQEYSDESSPTMFYGRLLDPLGNRFHEEAWLANFGELGALIARRAEALTTITRVGSAKKEGVVPQPSEVVQPFIEVVRKAADEFSRLLPTSGLSERFLGNASFRCSHGFPTFREGSQVFVSRRNTDKAALTPEQFVPVDLGPFGETQYYGEYLPSVDTPMQLRLYQMFPRVRYMLHGHVYVKGAPFTRQVIPCGALEEVEEIAYVVPRDACCATVNLRGHGCLLMADDPKRMEGVEFYGRTFPEFQMLD